MQDHLMECTWKLIEKHGAKDPFLDIGGGSGSLSLFLANQGWQGALVDSSRSAYALAYCVLQGTPVKVLLGDVSTVTQRFSTVCLFDVIEHVKNDAALLRRARDRLVPGGHILIAVPMHKREWRLDDNNYGHFRRYSPEQLKQLVAKSGFHVLELWDHSFPFFWLMRRIYTPFIKKSKKAMEELTGESHQNPLFAFFNKWLGAKGLWWLPNKFQDLFSHRYWGCHVVVIAKKGKGL